MLIYSLQMVVFFIVAKLQILKQSFYLYVKIFYAIKLPYAERMKWAVNLIIYLSKLVFHNDYLKNTPL